MARKFFTDADFQSTSKVVNLPAPTASGDAANKAYVDSAVDGLKWKQSCRVSTVGSNLNLASPGATIDGITMASQDRVLVRSQSTGSQNGIYIWNGASTTMTRALDANIFAELEQAVVSVEEGTDANTTFRQTAINGVIDVATVSWVSFGTSAPTATETTTGIAELATQAETDTGTDDARIVTPLKLANWSGRIKKVSANIGDGSATTYTVTHNLNSRDVIVRVFPNSGNYDDVEVDVQRTSVNDVALVFATAPATNAYRVVVIG
jgi:hypothetical protein